MNVNGGRRAEFSFDRPRVFDLVSDGELKAEGKSLKDGDLLSLGSFSALLPPKAGSTGTVRYTGLAFLPVEVSVQFE